MRLKHDRSAKFPIQLWQSIFIVVICNDVEVHEDTRGEYIPQRITFISTCFIGKSFAVLQNMQVINKQHNGINMNI